MTHTRLFNFFQTMKEKGNFRFWTLFSRQYFQVFPNTLKRCKIEILYISALTFTHLRRVNLEFFSSHEGSSKVDFYSFQNRKSQYFLQTCWVDFFSIQKIKFQNLRRLNNNSGDKLALSHNFPDVKGNPV